MPTTIVKIVHGANESSRLGVAASLTKEFGQNLINFLTSIVSGGSQGYLQGSYAEASGVAATATATFTAVVATDKLTVAGVDFTCVASGATGDQFNKGSSETLSAAACVAKINANATTKKYVIASNVGAVITITAIHKVALGNLVTLTETGGHITLSAAALAGGVDTVFTTYAFS